MKTTSLAPKPHFIILDGLRGVAAIMVLIFHIFEIHGMQASQFIVAHGYLAVDFFFVLSGFVIGYAYDDRWTKMSFFSFIKRRIIRLQPMVILGTVLGAIMFYFGASSEFPLIGETPVWKLLLYLILGILLIPVSPSMDIRGWKEMYTLDAPCWSLFFEYIANVLYGLFIRKFTRTTLAILVVLAGCATLCLTLTQGNAIGGWEFSGHHLLVGFIRLMYPFFAGLLLYRIGKLIRIKRAFLWCSLLLVAFLSFPRIGDGESVMNGLYEAGVILLAFPLIVFLGASGEVRGKYASKLCKLLGDISYPVYLVNYPFVYVYTGWISDTNHTVSEAKWHILLVFVATIVVSYVFMKFLDEPVRKWLRKKMG
jgi:peptidoglycan/LPS O-acetylase OafA/YrhL